MSLGDIKISSFTDYSKPQTDSDTIVAVATPPGIGGIGIVRLSGNAVPSLAKRILTKPLRPRLATLSDFLDNEGHPIDRGIALLFPGANSYTGEPVLELHAHGSPIVLEMLVNRCVSLGARIARPGEFSERAFLNDRLDLVQAEAVADLIESSTVSAAKSALNSLKGEFSRQIHALVEKVTSLRIYVEAAIDFPDEEIDFLGDGEVESRFNEIVDTLEGLKASMKRGKLLRDGVKVVLTGLPNAGKSSLLNRLINQQRAIVSAIAGTTRDVLHETIDLEGLPVQIIDTAGIRESHDEIEAEGVRRALAEQREADLILLVVDHVETDEEQVASLLDKLPEAKHLVVRNKMDLANSSFGFAGDGICLSALTGDGIPDLIAEIKRAVGHQQTEGSQFIARQRHIDAINRAETYLYSGFDQLRKYHAPELMAEDLTWCQQVLGEITGEVTSDDLLGLIFSSFCIGK